MEAADSDALGVRYRLPPPEIAEIVDGPKLPALSFSPQRDKLLFLKQSPLPPLVELARPEDKLAGIRIDGKCNTKSRLPFYTGIGIHHLLPDDSLGPEKEVHGFTVNAKINFVSWSPDGKHIAFSVRIDEEDVSNKLTVWVADVETGKARPFFQSPDIYLSAVFGNFVWVSNSTLLVYTIPLSRGDPPKKPLVPLGPKIQSNERKNVIQNRMTDELLKDEYGEDLFEYYATAQLVLGTLDGKAKEIGPPAVYLSVELSPDEKYLLITSIHRPYSYLVACLRFPQRVEVWTADGKFVREVCYLPAAEFLPIAYDSVRAGMRLINWRADKPSTLFWAETQDGGDAKVQASPRDILYTQPADPVESEGPEILVKLDFRFRGISWCDDSLALVNESWSKTRRTRTWVISPGSKDVAPRILFDRSVEDVYTDPGSALMKRTSMGTNVIAKIKKENDEGTYILLKGRGASPEGNIPFLDLFDINTGSKERIWESDKEKYYEAVVALMSGQGEGDLYLNQLKILNSKETKTEITQYYILSWPDKKARQITNFPHPFPQLASLKKELIRYQRKDGVQLSATLYLPPGYDPSKDGPLPCLVWAYPGDFKSQKVAEQVRGSPNEFSGMTPTSSLMFLARRFVVLVGPSIPIIAEGDDANAYDRWVEQLVSSAEAAVEEVIRRGVAHPSKIAVGGHSFGALMTASLLAHAPHLFCCGIARSGGYNKTLMPFGYQYEFRTLWEATSSYLQMSPLLDANKIKKPLLIVHGESDSQVGLFVTQAERFFDALKGHGALSRLVVLPFENHIYAARESIMHVLWESDRWLQKYCVSNTSDSELGP